MNLDDLTAAARLTIDTMLCSECEGSGVDAKSYVQGTHEQPSEIEPCGKCWDHPGIDPDVIHEAGPLRFNTMSIPKGVGAFVFVPLEVV